jgi:membrane protein
MHAIRGTRDARPWWLRRLIAMVMTIGTAAILISAMLTVVVWPQILGWLGFGAAVSITATIVHFVVVTFGVYMAFALAIRVGSNTPVAHGWLTVGNLVGTLVMLGASVLLRTYAQNWANYGATYGSLASIMLLVTWLWLTSLAMLVAALIDKIVEDAARGRAGSFVSSSASALHFMSGSRDRSGG